MSCKLSCAVISLYGSASLKVVICVWCKFNTFALLDTIKQFEIITWTSALMRSTHLKLNIAPERLPSQSERIVFQPPIFQGVFAVKLRGCNILPTINIHLPRWEDDDFLSDPRPCIPNSVMQAREGGVLGRPKVEGQVEQLMWPAEFGSFQVMGRKRPNFEKK